MRGTEITVVKKGGKPPMDDDRLLDDVIREVAGRIDNYDTDSLMGSYRQKMNPSTGVGEGADVTDGPPQMVSKEECPDCAKGECSEPEHMDEEMLRSMLSSSEEG